MISILCSDQTPARVFDCHNVSFSFFTGPTFIWSILDAKGDGFIESLSRPSSREGNQEAEALPNVVDGGDVALTNLQKSTSVQSLMTGGRIVVQSRRANIVLHIYKKEKIPSYKKNF